MQVLHAETPAKACAELLAHGRDDLGAVVGPSPFEYLRAHALPDLPIQRGQCSVGGDRHLLPRSVDHRSEVSHEHRNVDTLRCRGSGSARLHHVTEPAGVRMRG